MSENNTRAGSSGISSKPEEERGPVNGFFLHSTPFWGCLASRHLQTILANSTGIWFQIWRILLDVIFNAQAVKKLYFGEFHVYVYATFPSKIRSRMCNSASASLDVILLFSVPVRTWSWALMGFNTVNSSLFLLSYWLGIWGVSGGLCVLKSWFEVSFRDVATRISADAMSQF